MGKDTTGYGSITDYATGGSLWGFEFFFEQIYVWLIYFPDKLEKSSATKCTGGSDEKINIMVWYFLYFLPGDESGYKENTLLFNQNISNKWDEGTGNNHTQKKQGIG